MRRSYAAPCEVARSESRMERRSTSALPARHAVTADRSATEAAEAEAEAEAEGEAAVAVARERRHETASGSAIAER
jgi:hypothetical protein